MNTLSNKIMRRIYFAFAKRVVTHQITLQLALFVFALAVFAKMVHVHSVVENLLSTDVGSVPSFIVGALLHGEALTLIAIGVMTFTILSLPFRIKAEFTPHPHGALFKV